MSSTNSDNGQLSSSLGDDPVAIRMYARSLEAALDVATLEAHGIAAQITGDVVGDTLNWYGLAVQKVELVVPRHKVAEAQKILAEQAKSRSENHRADWICSGCGEVNGSEFDSCWSCSKTWSAELDLEFIPENLAQPLPTDDDPIQILPELDANPYAPPISGTVVKAAPGTEVETEIRRAFRSMILSFFFPPLGLYTFFHGAQTLSRISRNELTASASQSWRLRWIMIAAIVIPMLFLPYLLGMILYQG